ncbi:MAG: SMI1/KNR4 family protein [Pedobacter sp.]|nr:MAG: SMI1/KNR4 family protein [Pedobacter sp.]
MGHDQLNYLIRLLSSKGVQFAEGLTDYEVFAIERKFSIVFPPDLKMFLMHVLPVGSSFIDWRAGLVDVSVEKSIITKLNWPLHGMLFDVRENGFWLDEWGAKPEDLGLQELNVKSLYASYPKLVPVYAHRYISSQPNMPGNPVISINQTDIIYYGFDLADYFAREFRFLLDSSFDKLDQPIREIRFWSSMTG